MSRPLNYTPTAAVPNEGSGDVSTQPNDDTDAASAMASKVVTYVGASVAITGILMTLLSYIGYRKFRVKRPHIVMVNLCICLFLYYLGYLISNPDRQSHTSFESHICIFGAIVGHFSILAAWSWILVYWVLVLVMFQRPMGGHISHFFIKASIPSYAIPLIIATTCAAIAHHKGEMRENGYYGPLCFVHNLYRYLGALLPIALYFIPMVVVFVILLRGLVCSNDERLKTSNTRKNIKMHLIRLSVITVLFATAVATSGFIQYETAIQAFASMIVFGVVSSTLGLALMVLFCLHQEEIRSHWVSIIRRKDTNMRKRSLNRNNYDVGEEAESRKSSTLMVNHPSLYIDDYDYERKSSTYRIVAKEDTDMSTLGLIQIPGTPSPNRAQETSVEKRTSDGIKVKRKKSDASSKTRQVGNHDKDKTAQKEGSAGHDESGTLTTKSKKKTRSTSTPPVSPAQKSTKRQQSSDAIVTATDNPNNGSSQPKGKRQTKNSTHRLSRFARKSTSTIDEDTVQLTDFK